MAAPATMVVATVTTVFVPIAATEEVSSLTT